MLALLFAALIWTGLHVGIAGTSARFALVRRLGESGFRATFSLASAIALTLLILAWHGAPEWPLWSPSPALRWVLAGVMLPAFILLAGSFMARNPTALGQGEALSAEPHGLLRITRHPMLWAFALWAGVHIVGRGDGAGLLFFGSFLATALLGMPSIDAKVAARAPAAWARFAAQTSLLPFGAVLAGRSRLVWSEMAWPAVVGTLAWAAMLHLHPFAFGLPALPL